MRLQAAIAMALRENAAIAEMVTTWRGKPAVFSGHEAPAEAEMPFIDVRPPESLGPSEFSDLEMQFQRWNVPVVMVLEAAAPGALMDINALAGAVAALLNRPGSVVLSDGASIVAAEVQGPFEQETTSDAVIGRVVNFIPHVSADY